MAVDIPERWREALVDRTRGLEAAAPGFCRWVRPEGFHLTLAFLGNQPAATMPSIAAAVEQAAPGVPDFALHSDRLGYFGSRSALRVIWAGIVDDPPGALSELRDRVTRSLQAAEIPFDEAPFRPHITLGRVRRGRPEGESAAMRAAIDASRRWTQDEAPVRDIVLFQSELRSTGSVYTPLHRQPLAAPGRSAP